MKKHWIILLLLLTGCSSISNPLGSIKYYSFTPAQAINRLGKKSHIQNFKLLGIQNAPDGRIVGVYTFYEPPSGNQQGTYYTGYAVTEKINFWQWRETEQYIAGHQFLPKKSIPIGYEVLQNAYTAVYGPVYSQDAKAVEVQFLDGETVRESIRADYFLVFSTKNQDVCEIQAFGANDQFLYESRLSRWGSESDECYRNK